MSEKQSQFTEEKQEPETEETPEAKFSYEERRSGVQIIGGNNKEGLVRLGAKICSMLDINNYQDQTKTIEQLTHHQEVRPEGVFTVYFDDMPGEEIAIRVLVANYSSGYPLHQELKKRIIEATEKAIFEN